MLAKNKLTTRLMVDCSHANSNKKYQNQEIVWREVIQQRIAGNQDLMGLLVESNINEGNQPMCADLSQLKYGVSITDECLGWEKTEEMIRWAYEVLPA
jgi:3-deoxy-7-phosphoheptulonate synthase